MNKDAGRVPKGDVGRAGHRCPLDIHKKKRPTESKRRQSKRCLLHKKTREAINRFHRPVGIISVFCKLRVNYAGRMGVTLMPWRA
jgi:hypothetical protein